VVIIFDFESKDVSSILTGFSKLKTMKREMLGFAFLLLFSCGEKQTPMSNINENEGTVENEISPAAGFKKDIADTTKGVVTGDYNTAIGYRRIPWDGEDPTAIGYKVPEHMIRKWRIDSIKNEMILKRYGLQKND
jgi:hypothetical protein